MTENNEGIGKAQGSNAVKSGSCAFSPKLQEILADHHLWLESQGKDGKPADLSGWDLSGLDLADREGADLKGANLAEVKNLTRKQLESADYKDKNTRLPDYVK